MYRVFLMNLSADARTVSPRNNLSLSGVVPEALEILLANFSAIDPIENANAGTEIRVQVRRESYLLNAEQGKLLLYDMQNRDLPGQIFTWVEVMKELDGSAAAARYEAIKQARAEAEPLTPELLVYLAKPARSSWLTLSLLSLAAFLLFFTIQHIRPRSESLRPEDFQPAATAENLTLKSSLPGVYLTGNDPGQHGIVIASSGELKLFELEAIEAPRVVYVAYQLGRTGGKLCLVTDQPGGLIEILNGGTLVYGGENYRRIQ